MRKQKVELPLFESLYKKIYKIWKILLKAVGKFEGYKINI